MRKRLLQLWVGDEWCDMNPWYNLSHIHSPNCSHTTYEIASFPRKTSLPTYWFVLVFKARYILVFKVSKCLHLFFFRFPPQFSQLLAVDGSTGWKRFPWVVSAMGFYGCRRSWRLICHRDWHPRWLRRPTQALPEFFSWEMNGRVSPKPWEGHGLLDWIPEVQCKDQEVNIYLVGFMGTKS